PAHRPARVSTPMRRCWTGVSRLRTWPRCGPKGPSASYAPACRVRTHVVKWVLMHIGLGLQFNNLDGKTTDAEVYVRELGMAARAEDAGFDSVWASEHHFSDYQLTSATPMFLSWVAGQTKRLKLGAMVTVLPWHDPVRVA